MVTLPKKLNIISKNDAACEKGISFWFQGSIFRGELLVAGRVITPVVRPCLLGGGGICHWGGEVPEKILMMFWGKKMEQKKSDRKHFYLKEQRWQDKSSFGKLSNCGAIGSIMLIPIIAMSHVFGWSLPSMFLKTHARWYLKFRILLRHLGVRFPQPGSPFAPTRWPLRFDCYLSTSKLSAEETPQNNPTFSKHVLTRFRNLHGKKKRWDKL